MKLRIDDFLVLLFAYDTFLLYNDKIIFILIFYYGWWSSKREFGRN